VFLDDVGRRGEWDVVSRWARESGLRFEHHYVRGGVAIGRSDRAFKV
jgi:hypothetical protein